MSLSASSSPLLLALLPPLPLPPPHYHHHHCRHYHHHHHQHHLPDVFVQVLHAEQQKVLRREKRKIVHDKQIELPIRHFDDKSIYQRYHTTSQRISTKDSIPDVGSLSDLGFNDPYFDDQWYLVGCVYIVHCMSITSDVSLVIKNGSLNWF